MSKKPTYKELQARVAELEGALAELRRSQGILCISQAVVDGFRDGAFWIDRDARLVYVNETASRALGFTQAELLTMRVHDIRPGLDEAGWMAHWEEAKAKNSIVLESEHRTKDGRRIPLDIHVNHVEVEGNEYLCAIVHPVTRRKRAEKALRESEEKYRLLVENANEAIFIAQDGVAKFPNQGTLKQIGYSAEELERKPFHEFIHPDDRDMVLERHIRRLAGEDLPSTYPFRVINKNGEELWVELNTVVTHWEGRPATLNFLRDITEKKQLESQLLQALKMEAIGTLAGGIAHDFNNILMAMQGNVSLTLMDIDPDHSCFERLRNIEQYIQNGAALTRQLLGFARGGKYEVKPSDLNRIVDKVAELFGRTRKDIVIQTKYTAGIWSAEVDEAQIEQALLNLYVNAWQAMPNGGTLYLETENVRLDNKFTKPYDAKAGRYAKISVADTGTGMNEKVRERAFEPFFTTKEMGRGTGLGLASVYGIVKNHGGIITIDSKKGDGATFCIYLPTCDKQIRPEKAETVISIRGKETVLLVDDEHMVIDVGREMLKRLGYDVLTADTGEKAVDLFEQRKDDIDLVVLDMVMPGMGGGEVFDEIIAIKSNSKVLLSSGYSIQGQAEEIVKRGCDGFIQKPFSMEQLSQKTREILDGTTAGVRQPARRAHG